MRGFDYVGKRVLFAALTVFVAITLNFVLFRTLSGDAVSALRCRQCTQAFKDYQREQLGLDKSKWEQYQLYLEDLAHGNMEAQSPACSAPTFKRYGCSSSATSGSGSAFSSASSPCSA